MNESQMNDVKKKTQTCVESFSFRCLFLDINDEQCAFDNELHIAGGLGEEFIEKDKQAVKHIDRQVMSQIDNEIANLNDLENEVNQEAFGYIGAKVLRTATMIKRCDVCSRIKDAEALAMLHLFKKLVDIGQEEKIMENKNILENTCLMPMICKRWTITKFEKPSTPHSFANSCLGSALDVDQTT
ncbi:hypothetical protein QR680_007267 [Steinernema hermaphroditum]|uniref:Uncharacterized protein n=1 Tax=Steinernema hermaphroditum TaxID=289476 RepID=A0AA39LXY7_9BILA|nr:hypothetical protein QR680_007267 [Steinernema hermaphroditum]